MRCLLIIPVACALIAAAIMPRPLAAQRVSADPIGDFRAAYEAGRYYQAFDILARLRNISERPAVFGKLMGVVAYHLGARIYAMQLFEEYLQQIEVSSEVLANLMTTSRALMLESHIANAYYETIAQMRTLPNYAKAVMAPDIVLSSVARGDTSRAAQMLPFLRASRKGLLVGGVFANLNYNHDLAVKYFQRLIGLKVATPQEYRLHLLGRVNLGRVYYETGAWDQSIHQYNHIPRSSKLWFTALLESSWAHFQNGELNLALGKLHSFISPFLLNRLYPEALLVRSMVLFELCKFAEMATTLGFFYEVYRAMEPRAEALAHAFSDAGKSVDAARYFLGRGPKSDLVRMMPEPFVIHFKDHEETLIHKQQLSMIQQDQARSRSMAIRAGGGGGADQTRTERYITALTDSVIQSYAKVLRDEVSHLSGMINRNLDKATIIEIEMTIGQQEALDRLEEIIKRARQAGRVMAIAGEGHEFWPFYNEFWKDELGYYVVNTPTSCVSPTD